MVDSDAEHEEPAQLPESESESKRETRTQAKRNFTRQANNVRRALENKVLQETLKNRISDLRKTWSELQTKHDQYISSLTSEDQDAEEDWIIEPNDVYNDLEEKADRYIQNLETESTHAKEEERIKERKMVLASQKQTESTRLSNSIHNITTLLEEALINNTEENAVIIEETERAMEYEMKAYDTAHREYSLVLRDEEEIAEERRCLVSIREQYNKIRTKAQVFLRTRKKSQSLPSAGMRLERLKFQTFNGDLRKYPKFKRDFIKLILSEYKPIKQLSFSSLI